MRRSVSALLFAGVLLLASLFWTQNAVSQETYSYSDLLKMVADLDRLPYLVEGEECDQFSSYDQRSRYDEATGKYLDWDANGDSGNYIRFDEATGEDVMAEMKGPGFINRIWSANPQGKIRFYLDDAKPIELDFNEMFSGKIEPFRRPLVWQRRVVLGGDNPASDCYLPIPYQKSCKVTSVRLDKAKRIIQYYHIGYTTLRRNEGPDFSSRPQPRREIGSRWSLRQTFQMRARPTAKRHRARQRGHRHS